MSLNGFEVASNCAPRVMGDASRDIPVMGVLAYPRKAGGALPALSYSLCETSHTRVHGISVLFP